MCIGTCCCCMHPSSYTKVKALPAYAPALPPVEERSPSLRPSRRTSLQLGRQSRAMVGALRPSLPALQGESRGNPARARLIRVSFFRISKASPTVPYREAIAGTRCVDHLSLHPSCRSRDDVSVLESSHDAVGAERHDDRRRARQDGPQTEERFLWLTRRRLGPIRNEEVLSFALVNQEVVEVGPVESAQLILRRHRARIEKGREAGGSRLRECRNGFGPRDLVLDEEVRVRAPVECPSLVAREVAAREEDNRIVGVLGRELDDCSPSRYLCASRSECACVGKAALLTLSSTRSCLVPTP